MTYRHVAVAATQPEGEIPIYAKTQAFIAAVCREVPGLAVGVGNSCSRFYANGGVLSYLEAYLYFPGQRYTLMKIGYDEAGGRNGNAVYTVASRNIKNNKYRDHSEEFYTVATEKLERAVKNVKKYIRAYSLWEIADFTQHSARGHMSAHVSDRASEVSSAWRDVRDHTDLKAEMRGLLESGYAFVSTALRDKITEWVTKEGEFKHGLQDGRAMTYVAVREEKGEQVLDIVHVPNMDRYSTTRMAPVTVKAADADPALLMSIATINMVDAGTYVEGVGYKAGVDQFWVEQQA